VGIFDRLDRLADQLGDLIGPDDVRAHVELGAAYLERGDLEGAAYELRQATELRPEHARAAYLYGLALGRKGEYDEAVTQLERAAALREGFVEAHLALGELYRRRGELERAAEAFREALDRGVGDGTLRGEVYRGLGAVYLGERRLDKAVRELRKAVASLPGDAESQALLGRALFLRGDLDTARLCLERALQAAEPDPGAIATLAEVHEQRGRTSEARELYERLSGAKGEPRVTAHLGLCRLALAAGDARRAHEEALAALALEPGRPDILTMMGRALAAAGSREAALGMFDRALITVAGGGTRLLFDKRPVLEEALAAALGAGQVERAATYAAALLESHPGHPLAIAAGALAAAEQGDLARARRQVGDALAAGDTLEVRLIDAEIARREGARARCASSLRRAASLAPGDPRPKQRLADLYEEERRQVPADLYGLLRFAHRFCARTQELAELSPEAGRLVEVIDRPLLVTVMGEFSSGKSTFVNALLGEDVAPMGITPTTATINVLKYGSERMSRVVYLDDSVREVPWSEVPRLLRGLDAKEAKRIRLVEVLYPLETLLRVNVVDTPGLNSIHPEHEETARRFIAEADAVVWLFTADQAAKASEGEALGKIRGEGKKILGVLNKIDRCSPDELKQILAHVDKELGPLLETVVPFAGRDALKARRQAPPDAELLAASNYPALERALEERFFSQARAIQREAARLRLGQLLERAHKVGEGLLAGSRLDELDRTLAQVRGDALLFERDFLRVERSRLAEATEALAAASALEVLDFVRPRRWVFGSNQAAPADRDFLLNLLDERLSALLVASRGRVVLEVERTLAEVRRVVPDAGFGLELRLLDEEVFGRFRAFARGYLRGGRVDEFFTRALPKLELTEREVRRALEREAPWSDEHAELELRGPLRAWSGRFFAALVERLRGERARSELERFEVEERVALPVGVLRSALKEAG
jgi:tetratricopeptide (TPR) repeat protein/GTPase SAR1 family protein